MERGDSILWAYRERFGDSAFWAEPLNALTNVAFFVAAAMAADLAVRHRVRDGRTRVLVTLLGSIGVGSFLFHTMPSTLTKWLDIIPIALFMTGMLWTIVRDVLGGSRGRSMAITLGVVTSSFALLPVRQPMGGSMFYVPAAVTFYWLGGMMYLRFKSWSLIVIAMGFTLAVTVRSLDWVVPTSWGTHYLWHLSTAAVAYGLVRVWICRGAPRSFAGE